MEKHEKTMEKPWKNQNHGKPMEKNMEKPWKTIVSMKLVLFEMTLFYKVVPHGEMCVDLVSLQVTIRFCMVVCTMLERWV